MTVKHLQNLQRQQAAMSAATDPAILNKFRAGFTECAGEVGRFPGLDPVVKRRLLQHLANCLNQGKHQQEPQQQVQVHILPNPPPTTEQQPTQVSQSNGIIFSNAGGVQLVPTRLANGDIALVLPTATPPPCATTASAPLPLLVPIPTRTNSTSSAASTSSNYSSSASPEPERYNYTPPLQKPLSLVIRKNREVSEDEKPWRPW